MKIVPVSRAKATLTELVKDSETEDVILMRYGRPAAVIVSTERFEEMVERLEDLEDALAISKYTDEDMESVPFERHAPVS